ncbi:UNVERIFIED_CONTAM: hypothetical protein RMT77_006237 [Armadillidium vulgare]
MSFPTAHKTVFLLDHTLSSQSGVKFDLESLNKPKNSNHSQSQPPVAHIPLLPVYKSVWTCGVEALTEYCRIVWDIFPSSRLIRFIAVDKTVHRLNGWSADDQNLSSLMNMFITLGPAKTGYRADLEKGMKAAVEALTEPTAIQHEKRSSLTDSATKVLNKGRVIIFTRLETDLEIQNIKDKFHEILILNNKVAASTDTLMPINHCDLVLVNFYKENQSHLFENKFWPDYSTFLSCELFNLRCGVTLAPKLCNLVLRHYELASTTVTGIPMKEEQNASSSANYDVELFHPAAAHTAILKGIPSETAHLRTIREGTDYETVTLKWCTPRSNASTELQHCSSAYRITSVDVNSRPSSCLTNFLLNGRWVMLEMPRKSGNKVISHMLACHGGDIYIHTMYTSRSVLEDPPSISEGVGGRVTDYRIPDFIDLVKMNLLAPHPPVTLEEGEDGSIPLDSSFSLLKRHTKVWPITLASTCLFSLGTVVLPLRYLMVKETLTEDEIVECKNVIFALMGMETRGETLPVSNTASRGGKGGGKREEQYKALWAELEHYLKSHLHSPGHEKVLECLVQCQSKGDSAKEIKDEKVDLDQALMEIDSISEIGPTKEKVPPPVKTVIKTPDSNSSIPSSKKRKGSIPALAPFGKKSATSLFSIWESKINSDQAQKCPEFQGRLLAENNVTKLYANFQEKEKDDTSRKK